MSEGNYESMNLALHVLDESEKVEANRARLRSEFSATQMIFMNQSHGNEVAEVDFTTVAAPNVDAIFTRSRGLPLAVLVADCIPLLLHSAGAVAAIHVGRKGMVNGIIEKVVQLFHHYSEDLISADIGPAICGNCYEVDVLMYEEVIARVPASATSHELHSLDLPAGVISILSDLGVTTMNWNICTLESGHHYSYRGGSITGRQAGVIAL